MRIQKKKAFTLVELLVVIAIIGVLAGLLLPAVQQAREASRRSSCQNNLKQVGLAIHNHHDVKRYLPSSARPQASATVRVGFFTYLLPFIDQKTLWDRYDLTVNWDNDLNTPVTSQRITNYECPSSPKNGNVLDHNPDGWTGSGTWTGRVASGDYAESVGNAPGLDTAVYATYPVATTDTDPVTTGIQPPAVVDSAALVSSTSNLTNGFAPKNAQLTFGDVTDGLSNTVAVWESAGRPFVYRRGTIVNTNVSNAHTNGGGWCRPASAVLFSGSPANGVLEGSVITGAFFNRTNGFNHAAEAYVAGPPSGYQTSGFGTEGTSQPYAFHQSGQNVLLGDGAVRFVDERVSIWVIAALVTRNGGTAENPVSNTSF